MSLMVKKQRYILIFIFLFVIFLIPLNFNENNYKNDIILDIQASNQASANGNITEAEIAIHLAQEKIIEAENLGIYIVSISSKLQIAIDQLNIAIFLNHSTNQDFDSIIGNATLAKNSANQVTSETNQLINNTIIFYIVIIIVVITLIACGTFLIVRHVLKRLKKQADEDFLESTIIKKEEKK